MDRNNETDAADREDGWKAWLRKNAVFLAAGFIVVAIVVSACVILVVPGEATVVVRLGDPIRVLTEPGVALRIPAPLETTIPVDLKLKTTSSGLQDVGTRDGLRILIQAYVVWQVYDDPAHVRQFLRAVRNEPDVAAEQLRSLTASSLEIAVSGYNLTSLVNTDASKIRLGELENQLRDRIERETLRVYGVKILQVGIERLTLPNDTLQATVASMQAERGTVSAEREAEGNRIAAQITSTAEQQARQLLAQSKVDAAAIDAAARVTAADIYGKAYGSNSGLYTELRSLDTLSSVIGGNTKIILRTDAAPFRILVDGPGASAGALPRPGK